MADTFRLSDGVDYRPTTERDTFPAPRTAEERGHRIEDGRCVHCRATPRMADLVDCSKVSL